MLVTKYLPLNAVNTFYVGDIPSELYKRMSDHTLNVVAPLYDYNVPTLSGTAAGLFVDNNCKIFLRIEASLTDLPRRIYGFIDLKDVK